MLTLCGFAISNYYNKVKMLLLEKGLDFTEQRMLTGSSDEAVLGASPLGKIPYLLTDAGALCESQVINDYLEARFPQPALLPSDPFAAAKVRELTVFIDMHLELVARELYTQAFFGGTVSESAQQRVRKLLVKNIAGFQRLAKFSPFVAGEAFSLADCSAFNNLPLVATASRVVLGEDLLATAGIDWRGYIKRVGERPSAQRVVADRKAEEAAMAAARAAAKSAAG
jgi:glutathione S-transferase